MNRRLSCLVAFASLIVLTGCTVSTRGGSVFEPDATEVAAVAPSTDPQRVASGTLVPGETHFYQVTVSPSVADASDLIYYDIDVGRDTQQNGANVISLRRYSSSGTVLASSVSSAGFTLDTGAEATSSGLEAKSVEPQAIGIEWFCYGPCIIESAASGARYVRVQNVSEVERTYDLYAYGLEFQDTNEPGNDNSAVALGDVDSGAIEVLGDEDWFQVTQPGQLFFDSTAAAELRLRAQIIRNGQPLVNLPPGGDAFVQVGDQVVVTSTTDWAGSPQASSYHVDIR